MERTMRMQSKSVCMHDQQYIHCGDSKRNDDHKVGMHQTNDKTNFINAPMPHKAAWHMYSNTHDGYSYMYGHTYLKSPSTYLKSSRCLLDHSALCTSHGASGLQKYDWMVEWCCDA
mmetsp:Transcript_4276/g.11184  ORF Transcript_4276/g.11184 Transcript_4276/m.11184 type:complete len:116 (+) Transcript_4276:135-482(+)